MLLVGAVTVIVLGAALLLAEQAQAQGFQRRLGEFQVEWYCNQQGYGVQVVNSNRDWACLFNGTNTIAKILGKNDFDRICQVTYRDPNAIAIKDGNNPTDAYNWSCYAFR